MSDQANPKLCIINIYNIQPSSFVTDIVTHDYRTADVFRKYDIDFCCGGKWPLDTVCQNKNLKTEDVIDELEKIVTQFLQMLPLILIVGKLIF